MLQLFAFDRVGVVLSDLYFVDPNPGKGQEGPERGVRLEVRMMAQGELNGSIYSARPIEVAQPVWRADLLEAADGPPGSLNRAHHHPGFRGWEPGKRVFDRGLSGDPVRWVGERLADLGGLLEQAGIESDAALAADAEQLRASVPDIERALRGLLDRVKAGELAAAPAGGELTSARISWL
ncbi:MAG TPA: hypothetical protein VMV07_21995 [Streptosporangiaceae bacterium]|nr:hypothetical protein [Streptosporangiaceae bacterium]